ncbi:MAG: hypothetical protein JW947_04190 [Sedimentisphaerales bacterium]|nr:hypothetical protein [Sedimentisphaerales bacterium]
MNKAGNNEQFDNDILRCKADILRSHKLIPPRDNIPKNPGTQNSSEAAELPAQADKNPVLIPIEEIPAPKEASPLPEPADSGDKKQEPEKTSAIPSFDLAEEIMAEQRRITAIKRKAPGEKPEIQRLKPGVQPVEHIFKEPKPALSAQDIIITEIVAKDIERLCRGDYSADSR